MAQKHFKNTLEQKENISLIYWVAGKIKLCTTN